MEFSLFYFGNDVGADGYRLLLEGARFADTEGLTRYGRRSATSACLADCSPIQR
jgi:hypothetical protein